ncbi:MAG: ATP-binding protein [Lachnospiraceae bacterium]|nr:ATP-binding protein [Lachnospiraceae bacterium]
MKDVFLVNYTVQGVKSLEKKVSLSFYKKVIERTPKTQNYNIKAIYGMNGSGKSAIITSIDILRNLLINPGYLNNPIVQKNFEKIINKKTGKVDLSSDFIADMGDELRYYSYSIELKKDAIGKFVIANEVLSTRKATSKSEKMENIYTVENGVLTIGTDVDEDLSTIVIGKTANLLENSSLCELFFEKIFLQLKDRSEYVKGLFVRSIACLYVFGRRIHVYIDQSDDHREYFLRNSMQTMEDSSKIDEWLNHFVQMDSESLNTISVSRNVVSKDSFSQFEKDVEKLFDFIKIFKSDLQEIKIEKKDDKDCYICNLVMTYLDYNVDAEFESTGVKKLIKLYTYLREMVQGGIVFVDEFDSNLHDVYLCALLEYLMEYGKGQLCFTTHNVGPMDVLKQNKKSIDFLSVDREIHPWVTNGNYSPSKLYRGGMIEGSPFNVDSIDFIGTFDPKVDN